ncbi:MAG: transcriptional regulator [Telluria sp.]
MQTPAALLTLATIAVLAAAPACAWAAAPEPLPPAWVVTGLAPQKFATGVDQDPGFKGAKFLRNKADDPNAWAALTQPISAQNYLGQRIRFRAFVKTQDVSGWAGLWMRVDNRAGRSLAFYNSVDKPIKGSTDWQERSVVLDVPQDAGMIVFGVIASGTGQVWMDRLGFEQVGQDVPVDRQQVVPALPTVPVL